MANTNYFVGITPASSLTYGYSTEELAEVFSALADSSNWKLPIDRLVAADKLAIACAAIPFYCGGTVDVQAQSDGTFRVRNKGYYTNIGA